MSAGNQIAQIEELKKQVETGLEQLTNLEGILRSISGLNETRKPLQFGRGPALAGGQDHRSFRLP